MKRFGVLGALVFALLVAASPATAADAVFQASGTAGSLVARMRIESRSTYVVSYTLSAGKRACFAHLRIRHDSSPEMIVGRHSTGGGLSVVVLRRGVYGLRFASTCAWQLSVTAL